MKKIMFNDKFGLTQAVLNGYKTQTRRIIPLSIIKKVEAFREDYYNQTLDALTVIDALKQYFFVEKIGKLPYQVGEVVAIAQAYRDIANPDDGFLDDRYEVKDEYAAGWSNKMFVRSELMKHFLHIDNVRIERLQDISDEDCLAEGIYIDDRNGYFNGCAFYTTEDQHSNVMAKKWYETPREAYAALIDRISGKGTWRSNPYTYAYNFELSK